MKITIECETHELAAAIRALSTPDPYANMTGLWSSMGVQGAQGVQQSANDAKRAEERKEFHRLADIVLQADTKAGLRS